MDKLIRTNELLGLILSNPKKFVEARLLLNGVAATHFLFNNGKTLFNEGIDGKEQKLNFNTFENQYTNCFWKVDNIV
ncbi:MAG: hypothetical protein LBM67_09300 [Lentimicrobiaceae bacterium]|jgi:hypothetical protein|nr:hypothetical protein [Lentimicrobiaceae bacterium]